MTKWLSKTLLASLALALVCSTPGWSASEMTEFRRLAGSAPYRSTSENRLIQAMGRWQPGQSNTAALAEQARLLFNFQPRHAPVRQALIKLLKSMSLPASLQSQELHYAMLQNLEPQNPAWQKKLADLLYRKHGKHSVDHIKQAYSVLNKAFDAWDAGKTEDALRLFKQAYLNQSPEFSAIYAYHLRDAGRISEAKAVLKATPGAGYLQWIPDTLRALEADEMRLSQPGLPVPEQISALIGTGQLKAAADMLPQLTDATLKPWYQAKIAERQGRYHDASEHYLEWYRLRWQKQFPEFVPVVYKAQLEDLNSLDLIALKFRTSTQLIQQINERPQDWIDTYRMVVVPVAAHDFRWPASGYVSSHYGYRLHPIRGTWRLHEGIDIETRPNVNAVAAQGGKVSERRFDQACGNMVRLTHTPDLNTLYCHGKRQLLTAGTTVNAGQPVIVTGNTGASASNHLHFAVKYRGQYTDPMDWL
jgi:murein DD-endopeptidase MepM/ murein hydrolase activator NlpD